MFNRTPIIQYFFHIVQVKYRLCYNYGVKAKTTSKLKKDLWKVFSKFIRTRDKNICFTCDRYAEGSGMHAGHFITGATCPPELYFDELNIHAQCYHCNINLSGNWVEYDRRMIKKYGKKVVDKLKQRQKHEQGQKKEHSWYEERIEHYNKELLKMW